MEFSPCLEINNLRHTSDTIQVLNNYKLYQKNYTK